MHVLNKQQLFHVLPGYQLRVVTRDHNAEGVGLARMQKNCICKGVYNEKPVKDISLKWMTVPKNRETSERQQHA